MVLVELDLSFTSKLLLVLGMYVCIFGLISYTTKERLFISDAMLALGTGIAFGPIGANWVSTWDWAEGNEHVRNEVTYEITRIVIGIQVFFCGISLPAAYLKRAWKSLAILIGPVMTVAWLVSAALVYALIPGLSYLDALVIGACVAPTDPILANAIVKGRFAEEHVPEHVRDMLAAESGANDGLGVPFIYLAIWLMRGKANSEGLGTGEAIRRWFIDTVLYQIGLSVVLGITIGFVARKTLKEAERRHLIDHESFLAYGVGLTFFTLGVAGLLGTDDLLSCFIAGNSYTWDDYYRLETQDHSFQHVIDQLLNSAIFIYVGTILPWSEFSNAITGITPGRLVAVTVLILLLRRMPITLLLYRWIPDCRNWREAAFSSWFGPIGVSAIYYAQLALREVPEERTAIRNTVVPVVYFVVIGSVCVHGISIPVLKYPQLVKSYSRTNSITASLGFGSRRNTTHLGRSGTSPGTKTSVDPAQVKRDDGQHIKIDMSTARPFSNAVPEHVRADTIGEEGSSGAATPARRVRHEDSGSNTPRTEETDHSGPKKAASGGFLAAKLKQLRDYSEGPMSQEPPSRDERDGIVEGPERKLVPEEKDGVPVERNGEKCEKVKKELQGRTVGRESTEGSEQTVVDKPQMLEKVEPRV